MASSLFDLSGRVAIVTGSSKGIGREIAEQMAAHGASVVVSSRTQADCDTVAQSINEREGREAAIAGSRVVIAMWALPLGARSMGPRLSGGRQGQGASLVASTADVPNARGSRSSRPRSRPSP